MSVVIVIVIVIRHCHSSFVIVIVIRQPVGGASADVRCCPSRWRAVGALHDHVSALGEIQRFYS